MTLPNLTVFDGHVYALVEEVIEFEYGEANKINYLYNISEAKIEIETSENVIDLNDIDLLGTTNWSYGTILDISDKGIFFSTISVSKNEEVKSKIYFLNNDEIIEEEFEGALFRYFIPVGDKVVFLSTEKDRNKLSYINLNKKNEIFNSDISVQSISLIIQYSEKTIVYIMNNNGELSFNEIEVTENGEIKLINLDEEYDFTYAAVLPHAFAIVTDGFYNSDVIVKVVK